MTYPASPDPSLESDEHRLHGRFPVLTPALVVGPQGVCAQCLVEDLSISGARISGAMLLDIGEEVRLLLQLPARQPFSLAARVVRRFDTTKTNVATFGVTFLEKSEHRAHGIDDVVTELKGRHTPTPSVVLVVDTNRDTCRALVADLLQLGRRAIAVNTPLDAIEWLLDADSHIETALVDIGVGHVQGSELLGFLADEYPEVRRILMTDSMDRVHLPKVCQIAQPHAVLPKPWDYGKLTEVVTCLALHGPTAHSAGPRPVPPRR